MWKEKAPDTIVLVEMGENRWTKLDDGRWLVQGTVRSLPDRAWEGKFELQDWGANLTHFNIGRDTLFRAGDIVSERFIGYVTVDPYRAYRELERWLRIGFSDRDGP